MTTIPKLENTVPAMGGKHIARFSAMAFPTHTANRLSIIDVLYVLVYLMVEFRSPPVTSDEHASRSYMSRTLKSLVVTRYLSVEVTSGAS